LRYIRLRLVFLSFCLVSLALKTSNFIKFIALRYDHGTSRHIPVFPLLTQSLTSPQSFSLTNICRRRPSYFFNPVPTHRISVCRVCIDTDEVLFSFVVICAPRADNISNLLPLSETSSMIWISGPITLHI